MNSGSGALKFLQQRLPGLHVGGRAPACRCAAQPQTGRLRCGVWGDGVSCCWLVHLALSAATSTPPVRLARTRRWPARPDPPPGLPEDLRVAASKRAVLELLYEAGVKRKSKRPATSSMDCVPPQGLARATAVLLHQREGRAPVPHLGARPASWMSMPCWSNCQLPAATRWMSQLDDDTLLKPGNPRHRNHRTPFACC